MGPGRLLKGVAMDLNKSVDQIEQWSARWKWKGRVDVWDAERDEKILDDLAKATDEANRRHLAAAKKLIELGLDRLPSNIVGKNGKKSGSVPVSEARLLIATAIEIERKALGIADKVKVDHTSKGKRITGMVVEYVDPPKRTKKKNKPDPE